MVEDKARLIVNDIKNEAGTSPVAIFKRMAKKEYVSIHGPEHHVLDGACFLVAFKNAGGNINLDEALEKLFHEGLRMPGAMCGLWGVCGAVTSVGAALSIIDGTGPLSVDGTWGNHMQFTSAALSELGKINGPRCCKRDAMIDMAKELGFKEVTFTTKPEVMKVGYELYKRMGFEEVGEKDGIVSMRMSLLRTE